MNTAIIIPVHPPKSNWLVSFLTSYKAALLATDRKPVPQRIVLACSNHDDVQWVTNLLNGICRVEGIEILDVEAYALGQIKSTLVMRALRENLNRGIVNLKKFLAIHWAMKNNIGWATVVDADIFCTQNGDLTNFLASARANYQAGFMLGAKIGANSSPLIADISQQSKTMFDESYSKEIDDRNIASIYTWFMEPPTYSLEDVEAFFTYMQATHGSVEGFLLKLNDRTFDGIVFSYFRAIHRDVAVHAYNELGFDTLPEKLSMQMIGRIQSAYSYTPAWLPMATAFQDPSVLAVCYPNVALLYHCDRLG